MTPPIVDVIVGLAEHHRLGGLTDSAFAAAAAGVLPAPSPPGGDHPAWLTALAAQVAQLDAAWERDLVEHHAIPVRGGRVLVSRGLAGVFCTAGMAGPVLYGFLVGSARDPLVDSFRQSGWPAWIALAVFLLVPAVVFPGLMYWWAVERERAEADYRGRRTALILEALSQRPDRDAA